MTLLEFIQHNRIIGWTLIEYRQETGFSVESGRARIQAVIRDSSGFAIYTNRMDKASLQLSPYGVDFCRLEHIDVDAIPGGVRFEVPHLWCYAIMQPDNKLPN